MTEYEPGVCNIGKSGQRKRYLLGASGLITGLLLASANFLTNVDDLVFVGVAALLFMGFEGIIQARKSFCVAHASKGTYNVSDNGEEEKEIDDKEARKKDLEQSKKIHGQALAFTVVTTVVLYIAQLSF